MSDDYSHWYEIPAEPDKPITMREKLFNPVNNPQQYDILPDMQAIDIILAALTDEEFRGYCKGNVLKYRLRAGKKGDIKEDINKADAYSRVLRTSLRPDGIALKRKV